MKGVLFLFNCIIIISILGVSSCKKTNTTSPTNIDISTLQNYSEDWKEIEAMEQKGLGKSIIAKSNQILTKALNEKNAAQVFKAMAYRSKYENEIEEESTLLILNQFEEQILSSEFPLKHLLHSATAELYFQYYSQNRWRFRNRNNQTNGQSTDLRTWSLQQILDRINYHYEASLLNEENLIRLPIQYLKEIYQEPRIIDSTNTFSGVELRPSIFDFLAHRALKHYKRNEGAISKPIDEFQQDDYPVFGVVEDFTKLEFNTTDTNSNNLKSLQLYQTIFRLHENDKDDKITISNNLDRLRFAYQNSNQDLKDSLYLNALKVYARKHEYSASIAEIKYQIAQLYHQWGSKYAFTDEATYFYKEYLKKAYTVCTPNTTSNTFGGKQCLSLKNELEQVSFSFTTEKIYLPNEPILFRFQFKNLDNIYFRLYQLPHSLEPLFDYRDQNDFINRILKNKPIREFSETLNNPNDYQQHSTELYTQELNRGKYILIASNSEEFNTSSTIAHTIFSVSNLAFIQQKGKTGNELMFYALDRKSGHGIYGAKVTAYTYDYNYQSRKNKLKKWNDFYTNKDGKLLIKVKERENLRFHISYNEDTLELSDGIYLNNYQSRSRTISRTHFFTDRAIYRPGQTVYFKGIVIEVEKNKPTLKKKYDSEVYLYNVNGENLKTLQLQTNEFGSFQGSFILPNKGLNGQYRIGDKHGNIYFSVEEYKRPSFKVSVDTSNQLQEINSSIQISGNVKTYSGANVSDAKIQYRVVRRVNYWYWSPFRSLYPPHNEKEIANGVATSLNDGTFKFSFNAEADNSINAKWNHYYQFEIIIDATSPNGETQSIAKEIHLSDQSIFLSADVKEAIQLEELKKLIVNAKNINGSKVKSTALLRLWKLTPPARAIKSRYWAPTERPTINDKNFKQLFPQYPIKHEDEISKFPREYTVIEGAIDCNQPIELFKDVKIGAYEVEVIIKNPSKKDVVFKKRFTLYDENSKQLAYPQFAWSKALNKNVEVGERAELLIGTSLNNVQFIYEIEQDGKFISRQFIELSNEQKKLSIPIKESYRGNFFVHLTAIHSNRIMRLHHTFIVPFSNKKLKLQLGTYRNKVQPASHEKWTLTIQGNEGEKVAAELVAGMYDQSLDQFVNKKWSLWPYSSNYSKRRWVQDQGFGSMSASYSFRNGQAIKYPYRIFPRLNWFGFQLAHRTHRFASLSAKSLDAVEVEEADRNNEAKTSEDFLNEAANNMDYSLDLEEMKKIQEDVLGLIEAKKNKNPVRTDFRETAFFYPQLRTDKEGSVSFEFTMPEALTQWKFRALAHTQQLQTGTIEESIITQKELMIQPNTPRFFREKDLLKFTASIFNLSDQRQNGSAKIQFYNANNGQIIDISNGPSKEISFELEAGKSTTISWKIEIPNGIPAIGYRVEANSKSFSDGEEKIIPVLPNRILLTESLPLSIRGNQNKTFLLEKLLADSSKTLEHASFSLEFTSNPIWFAVQALPYISEASSECSEQVFSRFFANSLAEKIATHNPRIQQIFNNWKQADSKELISKLEQNQELKSILIEETPWLQQAKSESEQKKMIALLFDYNKMALEKKEAISKLTELQLPNGGWSWYKGMKDNRYITQHIVNGMGHLRKLGIDIHTDQSLNLLLEKSIKYLDQRIIEDYERLIKNGAEMEKNNLGYLQIHYLYTRSFFPHYPLPENQKGYQYFLKQAQTYWIHDNLYIQGMTALLLHRLVPESEVPQKIIVSLKDNVLITEELGMYWKKNRAGYYWYQSAVETQALLIELFDELEKDQRSIDEMRIWLLKQKQTQLWGNSKATVLACYAMLIGNQESLEKQSEIRLTVGKELLDVANGESGTGYFKKKWDAKQVSKRMGEIRVNKMDDGIAWGAAYWQYYEDLDKITQASTKELSITKSLFKVTNTSSGVKAEPIDLHEINVGDKISVELVIESKRDLEFVHLKDMRASCLEAVQTLSGYKYQEGLGYYESTKDASTNFFFDKLPKGKYVFTYELRVSMSGEYSNGISNIQCQYAPEFAAHSKGKRISVN